jgi:hypothetical protein
MGVSVRQGFDVSGQLIGAGHGGPTYANGNYRNAVLERSGEFSAYEVFRVIQAATFVVARCNQRPADQGQKYISSGGCALAVLNVILSWKGRIDILSMPLRPNRATRGIASMSLIKWWRRRELNRRRALK